MIKTLDKFLAKISIKYKNNCNNINYLNHKNKFSYKIRVFLHMKYRIKIKYMTHKNK